MPNIEDRKLTPKENYMRIVYPDLPMPEWAPMYTMGMPLPNGDAAPMAFVTPAIIGDPHMKMADGPDCWGVPWVGNYETGGAILPEPNNFLLEDIEDWHDVVKAPVYDADTDWEQMAKDDVKMMRIDRTKTACALSMYVGAFQQFVAFMGFTEGLIAMYEEPEEVKAMITYINDFYISVGKKYIEYLKPDLLVMMDDTAAAGAPFMGEDLFREILVPQYKKTYEELAAPYGLNVQFHNCGMCADRMEILHEEAGVTVWDPAQEMNDLVGFKKKWGRKIALAGGWDPNLEDLEPGCPDEVLYASVKHSFDTYAPDGGYAFCGGLVGPIDDKDLQRKNATIMNAAIEIGNHFYD